MSKTKKTSTKLTPPTEMSVGIVYVAGLLGVVVLLACIILRMTVARW